MNRRSSLFMAMAISMMCMTGCGTTELEERCFPQLVTVGYEDNKVTYCAGFPKLNGTSGQENQSNEIHVPTVSARSFEESRKEYEGHLNKLADYNHLKVLVLEEDFLEESALYNEMLDYLAEQEDFPRNTYVCAVDDMEELLLIEDNLPQDVGTYLELYLTNHEDKKDRLLTLGDLIDEKENQEMILYMPYLDVENNYVEWGGYYAIGQGHEPIEID